MKFNEVTKNRPEGDRVLDAPLMHIDLTEFMQQIKNEEAWHKNDRNAVTVFKTANVSIVLVALHKSAAMLPQQVGAIVTVQVLGGSIRLESAQGVKEIAENNIAVLHSNEPFNISAIKEAMLLLTVMQE